MDLQSALKYYKAVLPAYFSKSETETSQVMTQASWKIKTIRLNAKNATQKFALAYATSRQISFQYVVLSCFQELWKRKGFPRNIFINTNIAPKRLKSCKSEKEKMEFYRESTDIFKYNSIERYIH